MSRTKVIISNGSFRFHLSALAAELNKHGYLKCFFTAGYPTKFILFFVRIGKNKASYRRFLDRAADNIDYNKVSADNFTEIFIRFGVVVIRRFSVRLEQRVSVIGMQLYAIIAGVKLVFYKSNIYHYRNCYGGLSVKIAHWKGMKTICDHSIGHPFLIEYMTENKGIYPFQCDIDLMKNGLLPLYKRMYKDFAHNDIILVNSHFVKDTMVFCGIEESRIRVVYLGVDDSFLNSIPKFSSNNEYSNRLLFAGGLQKRKGILDILTVLSNMDNIQVDLAGGVDYDIANDSLFKNFILNDNVNYLGILPRRDLAQLMSSHRLFIFTSYCEGSARVIFEAMAAGLFIITTENSGSIVQHMVNGIIVKPGNELDLKNAINWVFDKSNYESVENIREYNFNLIRSKYTQKMYFENVKIIYDEILN